MVKRVIWFLTLLVCATLSFADDQVDEAIAVAKDRLQAEPQAATVYLELGVLYTLNGDTDAAEPIFTNGVTLADTATVADAYERMVQKYQEDPNDEKLKGLADKLQAASKSKAKCDEAKGKNWKTALQLSDEAIQLCPSNAAAYVQRAQALANSQVVMIGETRAKAIADYTKAIELCPVYVDAYLERGLAQDNAGLGTVLFGENKKVSLEVPDEAMADIEKAIEIQPACARAYRIRAGMFTRKHEKELEGRSPEHPYDGNFAERALADYSKVVELEPNSADAYLSRAKFEMDRLDVSEAIADLDKVLEIEPENTDAIDLRVEFYERDLEWAKLVRALSILISNDSTKAERFDLRGETYLRLGELDKAMADFDSSIALAKKKEEEATVRKVDDPKLQELLDDAARERGPRSVRADVGRGRVLAAKGQKDDALAAFDEALKLNPKSVDAFLARGELYQVTGSGEKAQTDFNSALGLSDAFSDKKPKARMEGLKALYYTGQKDTDNALKAANDATFYDPTYSIGFAIQAQLFASKKDADGAIKALDQLVKLTPRDADAYLARAQMYVAKKDAEQAINNYSSASKLRPEDVRIWATLGELEFKVDDTGSAIYCFEKVQELKPEHAPTKLVLAILYAAQGDREDDSKQELEAGLANAKPEEIRSMAAIAQAVLKRHADSTQLKTVAEKLQAAAGNASPPAKESSEVPNAG